MVCYAHGSCSNCSVRVAGRVHGVCTDCLGPIVRELDWDLQLDGRDEEQEQQPNGSPKQSAAGAHLDADGSVQVIEIDTADMQFVEAKKKEKAEIRWHMGGKTLLTSDMDYAPDTGWVRVCARACLLCAGKYVFACYRRTPSDVEAT